jgi:peptide/nickel transport system substrate-binding protein
LAGALPIPVCALLAAAIAILSACSGEPRPADSPAAGGLPPRGGELVASLRSEPANYNRYFEASAATDLVTLLTQGRLVRINRQTDDLEPALAESWSTTDGLTYTLKLRPNVRFADGQPFTAEDVVFSFDSVYGAPESVLASGMRVAGKPLKVAAVDPTTVTITFPQPFAPALRLLDNLPILPRHKLLAAYTAKKMKESWTTARPPTEMTGLGPFVLAEHVSGQRMVFTRNPHYWRLDDRGTALPYLDRLRLRALQTIER